MWRTGVVLVVSCLAVALAFPEVRVQNVIANSEALIAETKQADTSRIVRSFQDEAVQHAKFLARHNTFATTNQAILKITGQSTVLQFGTTDHTNVVGLNLNVNLDEDLFFVFAKDCADTPCSKDQKDKQHFYDPSDLPKAQDKTGADIAFHYVIPSSGNTVDGDAYNDRVGLDDKTALSTTQLFATAVTGDNTKNGLPGVAEGSIGLGFEQTGGVEFSTVNNLFAYTNGNPYITIQRDPKDMTTGVIAIGYDKYDACNYNRTTAYQTAYYSTKTKSNYWWFTATATIGGVNESVTVKLDLNSDTITLPAKYLAEVDKSGGSTKDNSVTDFGKLPILKLDLGKNDVLVINGTVYSDGAKKLYLAQDNGKNEYSITLGSPFLRYYCAILYGKDNKYSMAFTMPDPPPTKFATVSGVSFMALLLVPLVNLLRF